MLRNPMASPPIGKPGRDEVFQAIRSTCAHHFQNIVGRAWIGIVPNGEVIGLSKFNRIVHHIAERPQIQEEMTTQIAEALQKYAKTPNVAVLIKAEHH